MGSPISLSGDDESELRGYWDKLAEGGTVVVPLEPQMWGDTFGQLVDRFGVSWMIEHRGAAGVTARGVSRLDPAQVTAWRTRCTRNCRRDRASTAVRVCSSPSASG